MGWMVERYDSSGRRLQTQTFSGAALPSPWGGNGATTGSAGISYSGKITTSTDQDGKSVAHSVDGVGRVASVSEGGVTTANYTYDPMDNLVQVVQGSQTRSFVYTSLSRLQSATSPELGTSVSGMVFYTYDNGGNLSTRSDPRVTTEWAVHDGLNRPTTITYSDGTPQTSYTYDTAQNGRGLLGSVTAGVVPNLISVTRYTNYDKLGRVTSSQQETGGQTYSFGYTYDRAGNLRTMTLPTARVLTYSYDGAGRVSGLTGMPAGGAAKTYLSQVSYAAHQAAENVLLGNGLWEKRAYNSRLQTSSIRLGTPAVPDSTFGSALDYGSMNNNGNVRGQTITGSGLTRTQNYT